MDNKIEQTNFYFNKWWLMLVHGILLILLSYFLFSQPQQLMDASITIAGFIALLTGALSVIGYFLAGKNEKNTVELVAGIFSALAGLFFLSGISPTHDFITWFFALFISFNAVILITISWQLKEVISWWWISTFVLLFTIVLLYFFITGTTIWGVAMSVFAGIHFFITGILFIILAFVVRKVQEEYSKTIRDLQQG